MKHIFLITLACIFFSAHSQQITKTIYFENDEYVLDEKNEIIITSLIEFIQDETKEVTSIDIYGFADTSASVNYNKDLSKKRCEAVITKFNPGLPKTLINKINIHWFGELKPESVQKELHYSEQIIFLNYLINCATLRKNLELTLQRI